MIPAAKKHEGKKTLFAFDFKKGVKSSIKFRFIMFIMVYNETYF